MQNPHRSSRELWWAFFTTVAITLIYLFVTVTWRSVPAASSLFGHALGITGFILMLMTETLYSFRKRSRNAHWGYMSTWLEFHTFTGLVGPYMVLLHTSWTFKGLAGVVMLLTIVIVISGFIGRYIYTAVPRTADGIEVEAGELERQILAIDENLKRWREDQSVTASSNRVWALVGNGLSLPVNIFERRPHASSGMRAQARYKDQLIRRRRALRRQINSIATVRRLLAAWHLVHIPLGVALFILAFIHAIGAFYFATLLH